MSEVIVAAILRGIPWTIALTLVALLIGILIGAVLCGMRTSGSPIARTVASLLILTFRSIPPIVWLFIIYFGIGTRLVQVSPFQAAAIGLGLITAANMAEIFRGALSAIHRGQWEAAHALSIPARYRFSDVIAPQLMRISLPSAVSYAIGLMKDTAIASTIGVTEVAFQASNVSQVTFRGLESFALAGAVYIVLSVPIAWISRSADKRLRLKVAR